MLNIISVISTILLIVFLVLAISIVVFGSRPKSASIFFGLFFVFSIASFWSTTIDAHFRYKEHVQYISENPEAVKNVSRNDRMSLIFDVDTGNRIDTYTFAKDEYTLVDNGEYRVNEKGKLEVPVSALNEKEPRA